jgi:hypothetical protein
MLLIRLLFLWCCLGACCMIKAQDAAFTTKAPQERAQWLTDWMERRLQLNAGQVKQVAAINLAYARRNEPILKGKADRATKWKQLQALQVQKDAEMKRVLTAQQFVQYSNAIAQLKKELKKYITP